MKNSPSTFTEAALLVLFLIGIQYSDFGRQETDLVEDNDGNLIEFSRSI